MIEYRITAECDVCGRQEVVVEECPPRHGVVHIANHFRPPTWNYIGDRLICDEHQVILKEEDNS